MTGTAPSYTRGGLNLSRLSAAFEADRENLKPFRENRVRIVKEICGRHYGDRGSEVELPINLLYKYVTTVARTLIPHEPRVKLTTPVREYVPVADGVQQYVNEEARRQHFGEEMGKLVVDALCSVGVAQVALASAADSAASGYSRRAGKPFFKRVSLDDFVCDTHARDFREVSYIGHRFRPCLDSIRDDPVYSPARKKLQASKDDPTNKDGDRRLFELVAGNSAGSDDQEFEERVDLWQVYFPRYKTVCVLSDDQLQGGIMSGDRADLEPLLVKEWVGPDCGPYHVLGMFWVTDLLLPLAPLPQLWPLHTLINNLYRKAMDQGERQKTQIACHTSAVEDAKKFRDGRDGDIIPTANVDQIKPIVWPGPDQLNMAFVAEAEFKFNTLAGNLDLLGGAAQQAKTATQERLLNANASRAVSDMDARVKSFMAGVFRSFAELYYNHPREEMRTVKVPQGAPSDARPRTVYPHPRFSGKDPAAALTRHFPFADLRADLDPYSMQYTSPEEQAAGLKADLQEVFLPILGLLQQQGVQLDASRLIGILADYNDRPEWREIFSVVEPPSEEQAAARGAGESHDRTMPTNTTRTYERVNRSESTPAGRARLGQAAMLGIDPGGDPGGGNGMVR